MTLEEQVLALIHRLSDTNSVLAKAMEEQRKAFEAILESSLDEERQKRRRLEERVKDLEARLG